MINLNWLNTFCTLVETGHFTQTAEKLLMTQPGVTQHIQKLELQLDQVLIQRQGKQFELTDAGEKVYRQGQQTLAQLAKLEQSLKFDDPFAGRCRIASPGSVGLRLYSKLLDYQQQHATLELDYQFAPNNQIVHLLQQRQLDFALVTKEADHSELQYELLTAEALCLVTSSKIKKVDWPILQQLGYINHPDGTHHANSLLGDNFKQYQSISQMPHRGFSNQIGLILEPVRRGIGFTVLPANAVAAFADQNAITIHQLNKPVSENLYLVTRKWQLQPARVQQMIEWVKKDLKH